MANKASGLDGINIKLFKEYVNVISPHITGICNASINIGQFTDNWKKARVVLIFRNGNTIDFGNYWPISVFLSNSTHQIG